MVILKAILKQVGCICGSFALACISTMIVMWMGIFFGSSMIKMGDLPIWVALFVFVGSMVYFNLNPSAQQSQDRRPEAELPEPELPEIKFDLIKANENKDSSPIFRDQRPASSHKEPNRELSFGFLSGKKLLIEGAFVKFEDVYSQNFTVQANKISAVSVSPAGWGTSFLIVAGSGVELAKIKLPRSWAEDCMRWLITELRL